MSRPYAEVIGDPISHSKSPAIHNFWLAKLGMDAEYRACHVRPEKLADYFAARLQDSTWRGCNITIPHKETSARFVHGLLAGYPDIGAINVAVPKNGVLFGANTDVAGVVGPINSFHEQIFNFGDVPKRRIAIVGAGGAARAAVHGLKMLRFLKEWRFLVRRKEQGEELAAECGSVAEVLPIVGSSLSGVDILINASPLGMQGKPALRLSLEEMGSGTGTPVVFDMVYVPLETELLRAARTLGMTTIDGLAMLVGQADAAFFHFFGKHAPRQYDAELRALLTS
jgi:shikimate dehydrogenase